MKVVIQDWEVGLYLDDDGHLAVSVTNADESPVLKIGDDIADNEYEWCDRFSTQQLEDEYMRDQE